MIPTIIQIGPFPIHSFGLLVALAMFAAILSAGASFERNGLPAELGERYAFLGTVVGLIGARLWHIAENFDQLGNHLWTALFSNSGFTFHGGFILAFLVILFCARRDKIPFTKLADSVGAPLTICYMVGRLGCQLSGDGDYGLETTSVWSMSYSQGVIPTAPGVRVYPTPLFESTMAAGILLIILRLDKSLWWRRPLRRASAYFILISTERFLIEFLRINPKVATLGGLPLTGAQWSAMFFASFGLVIGFCSLRWGEKTNLAEAYSSSSSDSSSSSSSSKSTSSSSDSSLSSANTSGSISSNACVKADITAANSSDE